MNDARESANCSFTGITHNLEKMQMLLVVMESEIKPPRRALGHIYQQQSKT